MFDEKQLQDLQAHKRTINAISHEIQTDPERRREFLADPAAFLKKAGVPFSGKISLTDRDMEIVKLVADPKIAAIYREGDLAALAQYVRASYPGLVNDPGRVAWTVADFEVAIEAVAVAVGVFVAPVRPPEDFSELARFEAVQSARMAAIEARLAALEQQNME